MLKLFDQIGGVKKMILNKIAKNVRKSTDVASGEIFGVIKPYRLLCSNIPRKAELVGNVYSYAQTEKILGEIELRKSRAIEFVRGFQNRYL
jgi:hypothetical protein